ncbi:photolyase [Nitzschia inconspicua]|uniref:Photolyase n=1 Tax=Nitzschia inconspicua TaxID=303405 RepID=A0A9K3KE11_9STRA|nr:photolyase [Nitzschia inconspicua]
MSRRSPARVELFFKDICDLKERVRFLDSHGFCSYNLVNKNKADALNDWVQAIREVSPNANICCHYSLKYNKVPRKGPKEQEERLLSALQLSRANEVLIISGSGQKTAWNTVSALEAVKSASLPHSVPLLAVAYNPYFPEKQDQEEENHRLKEKLESGCITKVYLQFGSDLDRLRNGLEYLHKLKASKSFSIAGSLFLPTAQLISQQKFRPWNGVFLSQEFLSGPENAKAVLHEMVNQYRTNNVEILWEAPGIRTEKDVKLVLELTGAVDAEKHKGSLTSSVNANNSPQQKRLKISDNFHLSRRSKEPCLLIFGNHDVRIRDNRSLEAATSAHETVLPVFLWTVEDRGYVTGAVQVVLKDALRSLNSSLESFNLSLACFNCPDNDNHGVTTIKEITEKLGAKAVFWNRECTTEGRDRDSKRKAALESYGISVIESQSSLLYDPDKMDLTSGFHGGHWGTLMPFLKQCKMKFGEPIRPTPYHDTFGLLQSVQSPTYPKTSSIDDLNMARISGKQLWDEPIRKRFPMNEKLALEAMESFCRSGLKSYEQERSRADKEGATGCLSHHLRIGTLSPNQLYWRIEDSGLSYDKVKTFSRRLFWRDLAYYQLACFPNMRYKCIRSHYEDLEWVIGEEEKRRFNAWKRGKTGFPIVDAAMRELYETGWITQSLRMVVASFLVEYLRVNWTKGCEWFHYTLVDADSAINPMMWQNAGKSGTDQWNFILSPTTASQDPSGNYTRRWVPELSKLSTAALVHRPWEATEEQLESAGIVLGETYPHRIIRDLKAERNRSVDATLEMRRRSQQFNSDRGYDLIHLPNGDTTVVFTKKEYRLDSNGQLFKDDDLRQITRQKMSGNKAKLKSKRNAKAKSLKL